MSSARLISPLLISNQHTSRFVLRSSVQRAFNSNATATVSLCATVRQSTQSSHSRNMSNSATNKKCLNIGDMNPHIKSLEYAVRGPLVIRAGEIEKELENGVKKPFKEVIKANIGDCHAMGQVPITFIRQVMALVTMPDPLMKDTKLFPADARARAQAILNGCRGGSVGSYTDSPGIEVIRKWVAQYIERRDGGIPADYQNIIISSGASDAIKNILKLFICDVDGKHPGVLIPIPQYPLYSATLAEFNITQVGYFLDEDKDWGLDVNELQRSYDEASSSGIAPRAIVVINPGNPTGQVLSRNNIEAIIKFSHKNNLFILADEVYQDNVYAQGSKFFSFKKVLMEMGEPFSSMELASFMSVSKGYMGECGLRGGYAEVLNMCPQVRAMYLKAISAMLCPTVLGQTAVACVVSPPQPGETSHTLWAKERQAVLDSLHVRAKMVADTFNSMEGFKCNPVQGAMYAFPAFELPQKAQDAAKAKGQAPDVFYAFQLLERTGICIVPGSGFGQRKGTFHFRTTILPQPEKLKQMLEMFRKFHGEFLAEYK